MSIDPKSTYYDTGGISVLDVIKAKCTHCAYNGYENFLYGNAIKYILRMPFKGQELRDIDKAIIYLKKLKEERG